MTARLWGLRIRVAAICGLTATELNLADVYQLLGRLPDAAAYQHQVEYQAERHQQQIQLLERENAVVRTTRTALAVIAALFLVTLASLYARYRWKNQSEARLRAKADDLSAALDRVQTLRGMLPICAWCKKIREDNGYWTKVESYVSSHSAAEFTHCICPACANNLTDSEAKSPAQSP